jgi:acetyl-CoA decarbonylase/synthase complex subunit gamma
VVGNGVRKATTGGETVQYRHEKTFYNPTLLAAQVGSDMAAADLEAKLKGWNALQFERVGLNLRPELVAVKDVGGNADAFAAVAKQVAETSEFNLILMTEDADVMKAGVAACAFKRPSCTRPPMPTPTPWAPSPRKTICPWPSRPIPLMD